MHMHLHPDAASLAHPARPVCLQTLPTTSAREWMPVDAPIRGSGGPAAARSLPARRLPLAHRRAPPCHVCLPHCRYAYLYHQKDMLEDHKRTGAYYNACMQNRAQFNGKVVLVVGTGSGILAIFAAKAGGWVWMVHMCLWWELGGWGVIR